MKNLLLPLFISFVFSGCGSDDIKCNLCPTLDSSVDSLVETSDSLVDSSDADSLPDTTVVETDAVEAPGPTIVTIINGAFVPNPVSIHVGDTVRWEWSVSGHSVTSGTDCVPDNKFCSPFNTNCGDGVTSPAGSSYEHTFTSEGPFPYFCFPHCSTGMIGAVNVSP